MLRHRQQLTPYLGSRLRGVIERTYLRGERIYEREGATPAPTGRLLVRRAP